MPRLTKRIVDAAAPAAREYFLWDEHLRGFGVRIQPTGRKSFFVQYRSRGRTRRHKVGFYGPLSLEEARVKALGILNQVANDEDPSEARRIDRRAITMKEFIETFYLPEAERGLVTYRGKPKKPSTLVVDKGRIARHILPLLGHRRLIDLRRQDILRFIDDVTVGRTRADVRTRKRGRAMVDGGPGTAKRTAGLLGGIFTHAVVKGILEHNPCHGVPKRFADKVRTRVLTPAEYQALHQALVANTEAMPTALAAIRFLALTGFRKGEVQGLQWVDLNLEGQHVVLRDSKAGPQVRAIGAPVVDLLRKLPRSRNPHVFWGTSPEGPFLGLPKLFQRLCVTAELNGVTLHTLRHSFATVAAELGLGHFTVAGLLGHRAGTVTEKYSHLPDAALRAGADLVAMEIERRFQST